MAYKQLINNKTKFMRKKLFLKALPVLAIVILTSVTSCEKVTLKPVDVGQVSFSEDLIPIFTKNCAGCHSDAINPDLRAENAYKSLTEGGYINTEDPENSELLTKLNSGSHQARATEVEKEKIKAWIEQGAKND
jgi:hypothetical protein